MKRSGSPDPDLSVVGDVGLQAEGRHRMRRSMWLAEPEIAKPRVSGEIEDDEVEAHVHVPVVIDPLRADKGAVPVERSRDVGVVPAHARQSITEVLQYTLLTVIPWRRRANPHLAGGPQVGFSKVLFSGIAKLSNL